MTRKRFSHLPALLGILLSTLPISKAQLLSSKPSSQDVSAIVSRAAAQFFKDSPHAVGLSIGVLKDGKTYTYNYGTVEKEEKRLPRADTLYQIASVTKTFTGTLLAQAVIEKKVKFDDDVREYLDGDYPNLEFQGHPVRLGYLVNHNSGLPFNLPDIPENRPPFPPVSSATRKMLDKYTRNAFLADLHTVELKAVPGEKFSYSNSAAVLLSIVLERVYRMPYEELVERKIAKPLGMKNTTISVNRSQKRRLARGYDENGKEVPGPPDILLGAAALKSTVSDLLKYAGRELAEKDPAVRISHEPRFIVNNNYSVGLNWQMIRSGSYRRIWQEGSLPGFLSMCVTFPEMHMAIVGLANEDDRASSHALTVMVDGIAKALDARSAPLLL
ncbi:MAG TPA: serine hydrolase domain-containing protein [Terriglobales bacterium]|jgi:CubicO group peptidase (beta-lactamase class C family)|nr:serine hydrolase domain-containing protein [Terriglobales bacterium]